MKTPYNFYRIFFIPAMFAIADTIIMARSKKEAIYKLVGEQDDLILKVYKVNENPLLIGE